jgi:hypothetical protein
MVRAGWGVVYTGKGAEYGGWGQDAFLAAQAEAQYVFLLALSRAGRASSDWRVFQFRTARRGIWHAGTDIETPAEYKKRHRAAQEATTEEELETELEPEAERMGILDRFLRRRK